MRRKIVGGLWWQQNLSHYLCHNVPTKSPNIVAITSEDSTFNKPIYDFYLSLFFGNSLPKSYCIQPESLSCRHCYVVNLSSSHNIVCTTFSPISWDICYFTILRYYLCKMWDNQLVFPQRDISMFQSSFSFHNRKSKENGLQKKDGWSLVSNWLLSQDEQLKASAKLKW